MTAKSDLGDVRELITYRRTRRDEAEQIVKSFLMEERVIQSRSRG